MLTAQSLAIGSVWPVMRALEACQPLKHGFMVSDTPQFPRVITIETHMLEAGWFPKCQAQPFGKLDFTKALKIPSVAQAGHGSRQS